MNKQIKTAIISGSISFMIGIFFHYGVDYVYSMMRSIGLTPALPYAKERDIKTDAVDIYIIPFEGFSESIAEQISATLSEELHLNVQAALSIPLDHAFYDKDRKQYVCDSLHSPIQKSLNALNYVTEKTCFIALLQGDMYPQKGDWNYMFSQHWPDKISVVATERMVPYGVLDWGNAEKIYGQRLLKMVKRTIGLQYFGLKRSSDKNSIMYSPIMSAKDVDQMGASF